MTSFALFRLVDLACDAIVMSSAMVTVGIPYQRFFNWKIPDSYFLIHKAKTKSPFPK